LRVPLLGQVACILTRLKTHHPKQFMNNTLGKPQKCGPIETKSYRGLIKQVAKAIEKIIIYLCACIEFLCK
jgi:hypothetical protein